MDETALYCAQCNTAISAEEVNEGLAVRVDGRLVCSMCVDTLPGEAQVQINRIRAVRGMNVTTYQVENKRLPGLKLYSFTNSANITGHRRQLATEGYFDAPLLPPPQAGAKQELPAEQHEPPRSSKVASPNRQPLIIAAIVTVVVLGGISIGLSMMGSSGGAPTDKSQIVNSDSQPSQPSSVKPIKTRFDYAVDPLLGFQEASKDQDCPDLVREAIIQELVRKRTQQLDDADIALFDKRLDDVNNLANALTLPDDVAFRDLRTREEELRTRLLNSRTVAKATPVVTTTNKPETNNSPAASIPPAAPIRVVAAGAIQLAAESANISGTYLRIETGGNRKTLAKWNRAQDAATWQTTIPAAGNYRIDAVIASETNTSVLVVEIAGQLISAPTPATSGWFTFQHVFMGIITISEPGEQIVRVRPEGRDNWRPLNLAELILTPTTDPVTSAPSPASPINPVPVIKNTVAVGRFVRVELPRKEILSLAEVEVFSDGVNIAKKGKASQSSTGSGGDPKRAIDGNTDGNFHANSTTHTNSSNKLSWWEVDLGAMQPIEAVTIWNRTDCCGERLNGFVLLVLDGSRKEVARVTKTPTPQKSVRIDLGGVSKPVDTAKLWKSQFVQTPNTDAIRPLPLDGSEDIPTNWPGGTNDFFRSTRGGPKKRQMLQLDLTGHDASEGGIVLLLHPMRSDRKQIIVTLSDAAGKSVSLPPVTFAENDWTVAKISTKGLDLDAAALEQLTLEDDPGQRIVPEDGGFLLARLVTTAKREPQKADLRLRDSSLLRDDNRVKNLPRLLNAVSRFSKRPWRKTTELNRLHVLSATSFDQNWRVEAKKYINEVLPNTIEPLFSDLVFQDGWLDDIAKGAKAPLNPAQHHIAVLLTGGEELSIAPTTDKVLENFWRKRLEQFISLGVIPVVVLGPNRQSGDRRDEAEKLWEALAEFVAKRQLGIAVIDLRKVKTAPNGDLNGANASLAGHLLADGLNEFFYSMRCSGGVKP